MFIKTKRISKIFMWLAAVTVCLSTGSLVLVKNKVGADAPPQPTYAVIENGTTSANLIMVDVPISDVTDFNYFPNGATASVSNNGIIQSSDVSQCGGILPKGDVCYILTYYYNNAWHKPQVLEPAGVGWQFLKEIEGRVPDSNTRAKTIVSNAEKSYTQASYNAWAPNGVDFSADSEPDGHITIKSPDLIEKIGDKVNTADHYVTKDSPVTTITVRFSPSYNYMPNRDSLWLASIDTVLGAIDSWETLGVDLSKDKQILLSQRSAYVNYADAAASDSSSSSGVLSISGPQRILIGTDGRSMTEDGLTLKIDSTTFPAPATGYKTQIFIKPTSKPDDATVYTFIQSNQPTTTISWNQILGDDTYATSPIVNGHATKYTGTAGTKDDPTGDRSYEKRFPQEYTLTAITYGVDTSKPLPYPEFEQARLSYIFSTTNDSITDATSGTGTPLKGSIQISANDDTYNPKGGKPVHYTVALTDRNSPHLMRKIVVWVCTGDAKDVAGGDSETCQAGGVETTKAAFITSDVSNPDSSWHPFTYDTANNSASPEGDWDISGSTPGVYSLMVKGHSSTDGGATWKYVEQSKEATTVNLTNSAESDNSPNQSYANALNFGDAFSNGSSITSVEGLGQRVISIILVVIGGLSVIAIIIGGIFYISSGGDEKKSERGKKTLIYAIIGIVVAASGWAILSLILDIISQIIAH